MGADETTGDNDDPKRIVADYCVVGNGGAQPQKIKDLLVFFYGARGRKSRDKIF